MTNQFLSKKEVKSLLHFKSDTSLYTLEQKDETFPQKIRISLRELVIVRRDIFLTGISQSRTPLGSLMIIKLNPFISRASIGIMTLPKIAILAISF